ncbi:MAG: hypothetical protein ACRC68_19300, partial [Clostridium sp.]
MKLSKKVTLIFLISTIFSLGLYRVMAYLMIDKMYSGENERIAGIAGGVVTRFKSEINSVIGKTIDYATLIEASNNINKEFLVSDGEYRVGLKSKLQKDNIEYKILLNEELSYNKTLIGSETDKIIIDKLIYDVKDNYGGGITTFNNIVNVNEKFYIVVLAPVLD